MTEFDTDTALTHEEGSSIWRGSLTDRWGIGAGANGGYIASFPIRSMLEASPFPAPLSMTTYFLQRPVTGPIELVVDTTHHGRGHAFLRAVGTQEHGAVVSAMGVFASKRRRGELHLSEAHPPAVPGPEESADRSRPTANPGATLLDRYDFRLPVDQPEPPVPGQTGGPMLAQGWLRLKDRALDDLAVPLFMDSLIPPVFFGAGFGMAPTIELTVHWRDAPGDGWHLGSFLSRFLQGGYVEEDGELWSEDGRLVAQSRQISRFIPGTPPA